MPTANLFTDYSAETDAIARRRKYAEMLSQQGMEPLKQETAGGYVVPISWTQGLAKALQQGMGGYMQGKATQDAKDLSASRNQALAAALGNMPQGTPGTAGVPEQTFTPQAADYADNPSLTPNDQGQVHVPAQLGAQAKPATMQQNAAWLGQLGSIGQDAVAMGDTMLGMQQKHEEYAANRDAKTMDRVMALDAAAENKSLTLQAQNEARAAADRLRRDMQESQQLFQDNQNRIAAQERAAQAKQMAGIAASNRQPSQPIVITAPDGATRLVDRSGNIIRDMGKIGPQSATFQKTQQQQKTLKQDLGSAISELEIATADGGLIDKSTGSGAGALVDSAAGFFGTSTPGAVAVGQLKPIYDKVLKMVPRFEGPQSDKDTKSYEAAAGNLANPATPNGVKKASAREILRLMRLRQGQFLSKDMVGTEADTSTGGNIDLLLDKYK